MRTYLDHNATTPLSAAARAAMLDAMDVLGNPSSIHLEGRAARQIIETARRQVADAVGLSNGEIVFTSGGTEAAAMALAGKKISAAYIEHPCVLAYADVSLSVDKNGHVVVDAPQNAALQRANSETGILNPDIEGLYFQDAVQAFGKIPYAFSWSGAVMAAVSAHKIGGPKGIGALLLREGITPTPLILGGGQEHSWRAGTENLLGIAGFGAAAEDAASNLNNGLWEDVKALRDHLEDMILNECSEAVIAGFDVERLPNTSNISVAGWKGETQVMQMDLAGFAISSGSACSSGKVRGSEALKALGYSDDAARSAIRVSLGLSTTKVEVEKFAKTWLQSFRNWKQRGSASAA